MYLGVKKQEVNYDSQISSQKCNKEYTRDAFTDGKKSSKVQLIYFKISKHGERRVWCFYKQIKIKKEQRWRGLRIKANKNGLHDVFTGSTSLVIHLEVKMPEERYK